MMRVMAINKAGEWVSYYVAKRAPDNENRSLFIEAPCSSSPDCEYGTHIVHTLVHAMDAE